MSTQWAASPSDLLMRAATRASARRRSPVRRRLTLLVGVAMLALAIAAITLARSWSASHLTLSTRSIRSPRR